MTTVAIVDDEVAFGTFIGKVAADVGFDVRVTSSVNEFRSVVNEAKPSVLVIDLMMPDADGIEVLRELGEQKCAAKIIMVSGMDSRVIDASRRFGTEVGLKIVGAFSKPIRAPELKQLFSQLLPPESRISPEAFRKAIKEDRFFLDFQPKVDVQSGKMVAVEALSRWRDEAGRVLYPDVFIPMAEKSGSIADLTAWVIDKALAQSCEWRSKGHELSMAINLSADCIRNRHLPDQLFDTCHRLGVPPESVILELTESASQQDFVSLLEILGRFRIKGFHLSIDDFGTGYSSIARLLKLPFSELKIDKSFVLDMDQVKESAIVCKTIVDMAHNLGLSVVAEGVENAKALGMLKDWGCDVFQGYLFSRPVDQDMIESFSKQNQTGT